MGEGYRQSTSKMGGVDTSALKNGAMYIGEPKNGGITCAAEGHALLSTSLRMFLMSSLKPILSKIVCIGESQEASGDSRI